MLTRAEARIPFIVEEVKETVLDFGFSIYHVKCKIVYSTT